MLRIWGHSRNGTYSLLLWNCIVKWSHLQKGCVACCKIVIDLNHSTIKLVKTKTMQHLGIQLIYLLYLIRNNLSLSCNLLPKLFVAKRAFTPSCNFGLFYVVPKRKYTRLKNILAGYLFIMCNCSRIEIFTVEKG